MRIIVAIIFGFSCTCAFGQRNLNQWKISNYTNGKIQDSLVCITGGNEDTNIYCLPDVIYVCRFNDKVLMVDMQDDYMCLIKVNASKDLKDEQTKALEEYLEEIEKENNGKSIVADSMYSLKKDGTQTNYKYDGSGNVNWIEYRRWKTPNNPEEKFELLTTTFQYQRSLGFDQTMALSNYLVCGSSTCKPAAKYTEWEFFNLTE